jgi:hypothetical protein
MKKVIFLLLVSIVLLACGQVKAQTYKTTNFAFVAEVTNTAASLSDTTYNSEIRSVSFEIGSLTQLYYKVTSTGKSYLLLDNTGTPTSSSKRQEVSFEIPRNTSYTLYTVGGRALLFFRKSR